MISARDFRKGCFVDLRGLELQDHATGSTPEPVQVVRARCADVPQVASQAEVIVDGAHHAAAKIVGEVTVGQLVGEVRRFRRGPSGANAHHGARV